MCKNLCKTYTVFVIVLTWVNFGLCTLAALCPWVSKGQGKTDGPLFACESINGCYIKDLSEETDSWLMIAALIGFLACAVLGSLLKCARLEGCHRCFIRGIIVTTIVSGVFCCCCLVLFRIANIHKLVTNFVGITDIEFTWGYYICIFECIIVILSTIIYIISCACWSYENVLCCCCCC